MNRRSLLRALFAAGPLEVGPAAADRQESTSALLIRGFRRVLVFTGRDTRQQFWPYAVLVIATAVLVVPTIGLVVAFPAFDEISSSFDEPGVAPAGFVDRAVASIVDVRNAMLDLRMWTLGIVIALLAAATTRRLRDAGRGARHAMVPAAITIAASLAIGRLFTRVNTRRANAVSDRFADTVGEPGLISRLREPIPTSWDGGIADLLLVAALSIAAVIALVRLTMQLLRPSVGTTTHAAAGATSVAVSSVSASDATAAGESALDRAVTVGGWILGASTVISLAVFSFIAAFFIVGWSSVASIIVAIVVPAGWLAYGLLGSDDNSFG